MKTSLKRALLTHGYRAQLVPGRKDIYDIYRLRDSKLVAADRTEQQAWQFIAGYEETKP